MGHKHYTNLAIAAERKYRAQFDKIENLEKQIATLQQQLHTAKFQLDKLATAKCDAEDVERASQKEAVQAAADKLMAGSTKEAVMEEFELCEDLYSAAHQEVRYRKGEF